MSNLYYWFVFVLLYLGAFVLKYQHILKESNFIKWPGAEIP